MTVSTLRSDPPSGIDAEEWALRVDLAACYRLIDHYGMTDLIFTHVTARVPGPDHHILINPYTYFFEEVTASNLVKCDLDATVVGDSGYKPNPIGFNFHAVVHEARDNAQCVIHTHSHAGTVVSAMKRGLLPLTQTALRFKDQLGFHAYEGVLPDKPELQRMVEALGDKKGILMGNHGLLVVGRSIPEAFHLIYYLEQACRMQIDLVSSGEELVELPHDVQNQARDYFINNPNPTGEREWPAHLRMLDRIDPSYRT